MVGNRSKPNFFRSGVVGLALSLALVAGQAQAQGGGGPDFNFCDSLTGAAFGLCRAGVAVGCTEEESRASKLNSCESIEAQFEQLTGTNPPWLVTDKFVFVTSTTNTPGTAFDSASSPNTFASLLDADTICQRHAAAAGLPGTYQAWMSTASASPSTRFITQSDTPYVLVDGFTVIANDFVGLTTSCGPAPTHDGYVEE
jgi:hypothetical protein